MSGIGFSDAKAWCIYSTVDFGHACSDYGYHRIEGQDKCVEDTNFRGPNIDVCFRGHKQKVISEG